jgi:hypothetical protein
VKSRVGGSGAAWERKWGGNHDERRTLLLSQDWCTLTHGHNEGFLRVLHGSFL